MFRTLKTNTSIANFIAFVKEALKVEKCLTYLDTYAMLSED
jgi:hypothetical protein